MPIGERLSIRVAVAAFLALIACLPPATHAQGTYGIIDLGGIPDSIPTYTRFTALNASGQLTGSFYPSGSTPAHAFRYQNGAFTDLGSLGVDSHGVAINSTGQIAGYGLVAQGDVYPHAFVTNGSTLQNLGVLPGGAGSSATAVNDSGSVTGSAYTTNQGQSDLDDLFRHAFLYQSGAMTDLGTLTPQGYSYGTAINKSGQVVGAASVPIPAGSALGTTYEHAFLYSNGTMTDINPSQATSSQANSINDSGQVVGSLTEDGVQRAAIYDQYTWSALHVPGSSGASSVALWINSSGQIVGNSGDGAFVSNGGGAALLTDLVDVTSIPEVVERQFDGVLSASVINDNGWILGTVLATLGNVTEGRHAVLLIPQYFTIGPSELQLGDVNAGHSSAPMTVTIANVGSAALSLSAPVLGDSQFTQTTTCGATLASSSACDINVVFSPQEVTTFFESTLVVKINGVDHTVLLYGTAFNFDLALTSSAAVASVNQSVTLTWTGLPGENCTASGGSPGDGWTGTPVGPGSLSVTEHTPGQYTYSIYCAAGHTAAMASATVTFVAPPSGGGGALDLLSIGILSLLAMFPSPLPSIRAGCGGYVPRRAPTRHCAAPLCGSSRTQGFHEIVNKDSTATSTRPART